MKTKHILFLLAILSLLGLSWLPTSNSWLQKELVTLKQVSNIDKNVLRLSLKAYQKASQLGLNKKQLITIIDYSKPSTEKRLWVIDLKSGKTLFNTWVSHGKNSGGTFATSFSNHQGSLKSSIGVFLTENPYVGGNGISLKLKGLERGVNDKAYQRKIVIHGAPYVNPDIIKRYGHIGRSWGCPAVSKNLARSLIDTIKGNTLVFAYYPDRNWLTHSTFLTS